MTKEMANDLNSVILRPKAGESLRFGALDIPRFARNDGRGRLSRRFPSAAEAKRNLPMRIGLVALIAVMLSFYLLGNLNAKFLMSGDGDGDARVAAFSVKLDDGSATGSPSIVNLAGIEKPGDSKTYRFSVSSSSEVTVRYWLQLEYDGSMPLEFKVTKGSAAGTAVIATTVAQLDAAIKAKDMPFTARMADASKVEKAPNTPAADVYVLTATWPASENNVDYARNSAGDLTVRAIAEQVD